MTKGMGMTFKPKPILQFEEPMDEENRKVVIIVKPCGLCNHTFHCMDVVVTPCKHTFHPFCLGVMLKKSSKCIVCNVKFRPNWWTSWGFGSQMKNYLSLQNKP
jgi:hypothetical protein